MTDNLPAALLMLLALLAFALAQPILRAVHAVVVWGGGL